MMHTFKREQNTSGLWRLCMSGKILNLFIQAYEKISFKRKLLSVRMNFSGITEYKITIHISCIMYIGTL